MYDYNEHSTVQSRYEEKKAAPSRIKSFVSMVTAGVIGSALTLAMVSQTNFTNQNVESNSSENAKNLDVNSSTSISPTQMSTKTQHSSTSIADIVEKASEAIVGIVNFQQNQSHYFSPNSESSQSGSGSGVIFKKTADSAYIVTNNHVIEGASEIEVSLYNGDKTTAEVVGADALTDLAVLKIDPKYATSILEFGDSTKLRPGDQVLAIGNPLGLDLSRTVTQGIVSAIERSIPVSTSAGEWELNVIQTDAAINPGNSGGALINTEGQVIGINSLKISESGVEGLGFAIPSNDLLPIVNQMIENGKVVRPYIGVSLVSLDEVPRGYLRNLPNSVAEGAYVTYIDPNSAAAKAGIQEQDVIVSINNEAIKASGDLRKYMYAHLNVADMVTLKLYRDGKLLTIQLTLTSNKTTD